LSGVVARFRPEFQVNFSDNGPFLKWAVQRFDFPIDRVEDLEGARLFRALATHPQQFPPYDWATCASLSYPQIHILFWGPFGRGTNKVPAGARTDHPYAEKFPDWQFDAPDEVSVSNSVYVLAVCILADILSSRSTGAAFSKNLTIEEARQRLVPEDVPIREADRPAKSMFDRSEEQPSQHSKPWA
jgi:hypothetical protein